MGYTGGLRKNGQCIGVPIILEFKPLRIGLGYDVSTPIFADTKRVLFVVGGVQTDLLEEKPIIEFLNILLN